MGKVWLNMIVRQEAAVIRRCLEAARPLIDGWSIVDTGSTDATKAIITEVLGDLPGRLHDRPWVNFGHNRSESLELARETAELVGSPRHETYALLLDADHELKGALNRDELTGEGYSLYQRDTHLTYSNTRLLRLDLPWRCVGVTHEYWAGGSTSTVIKTAAIKDHADGGTRAEKFERDLRLLEQGLRDEPGNVRYMFYLAQTYEGIGRLNDAAALYLKRAEAPDQNREEQWMARLRRAKILSRIGLIIEAQTEFLRCFNDRPHRAEPLYYLSLQLKDVGCRAAAYMYAKQGSEIAIPEQDILFIEHEVYRWGFHEEMSIHAHALGRPNEGREACEVVLRAPHGNHRTALHNLTFYTSNLPGERGSYEIPEEYRTWEGVVYNASSPTVCDDVTIIRCVNYDQDRGKHYVGRPEAGIIRTQNKVLKDGNFTTLDCSILETWNQATRIFGLEDIRLVRHAGRYWFTATTCQVPGAMGNPQVALGRLSEDCTRVEHLVPLRYGKAIEKNWLLWSHGDELLAIYSFDPFVVLRLNPETGEAVEKTCGPTRWFDGRFRGSAPPIRLDWDTWIAVVHDVANWDDRNVYQHRFVVFTEAGDVRYSPAFFLDHDGIEYVTGLSYERGQYTLTYSHEDREARWARVDSMTVREMVGELPRLRRAA